MQKKIILSIVCFVVLLVSPLLLFLVVGSTKGVDIDKKVAMGGKEVLESSTKIVVDIGHGGDDKGTANSMYTGDILEKDVNLEIGLKLVDKLKSIEGIEVVTTRKEDVFISLEDRAKIGNDINADMFVSIHCNATYDGNSDVEGIETFYYKEDNNSKLLANKVQYNLVNSLKKRDRGVKKENYQVLRDSDCSAILVECGFLTNDLEREQLSDDVYQDILVEAIVRGILEYREEVRGGG